MLRKFITKAVPRFHSSMGKRFGSNVLDVAALKAEALNSKANLDEQID